MIQKTIAKAQSGQKLIQYLSRLMPEAPKSFFYRMLREKNITLNRKKADGRELLTENDVVFFFLSEETMAKFGAEDIPAEKKKASAAKPESAYLPERQTLAREMILYEDGDIILINKPAGLLSQKAKETDVSLNELLLSYALQSGRATRESLKTARPAVCNRLDRNTSGIVTAGFTVRGQRFLSGLMKDHSAAKDYFALVSGIPDREEEVNAWLVKDEAKNLSHIAPEADDFPESLRGKAVQIRMSYRLLASGEGCSLIRIRLHTGKSHQIRAYFAWASHPVIGDTKYGDAGINREFAAKAGVKRQLLHAGELSFGKTEGDFSYLSGKRFSAPLPPDFCRALSLAGISEYC